ncbi:MAG: hypothetical protein GY795_35250 [Desulfobacterales bacterium]|nr:hypothetical protein [Desulfobacterales bacterium]
MVTKVKVIGAEKLLAGIGKALAVANVIGVVSFVGISGLIIWQIRRGSEGFRKLGAKIDESNA